MSLFEIRQYQVYPGKMDEWIKFMENRVAPFITARGMVVTAMFRSEEDENLFIWIRRFDNEAHREKLYKAVYESDEWQQNYKPTVRKLVDVEKIIVQRVIGTNQSPIR